MKVNQPQIVVINGMHRSGTMLFSRLVNALPDTFIIKDGIRIPWIFFQVEVGGEFIYPKDCYKKPPVPLRLDKEIGDTVLFRKLLADELESLKFSAELDHALRHLIESCAKGESYIGFFTRFFAEISQVTGAKTVGMKNTHMYGYAKEVLASFPQMKWIDIIRDSRGWYCSSKVSHSKNILSATRLWNKAATCLKEGILGSGNRYMFVTFEELILTQAAALQKVSDFMGLGFSVKDSWFNTVRLTENDGSQWFANSSYTKTGEKVLGDQNQRRVDDYKVMDAVPVYRWREKLSSIERCLIKVLTGDNLRGLGFLDKEHGDEG